MVGAMSTKATTVDGFWARVHKTDGCWLWSGLKEKFGYGVVGCRRLISARRTHTHRLAWELTYGPIPDGLCVLHRCDVPACCRPSHLFLGTRAENMADKTSKGRTPHGEGSALAKLSAYDVEYIRANYGFRGQNGKKSAVQMAKELGVTDSTVRDIVKRKLWAHVK